MMSFFTGKSLQRENKDSPTLEKEGSAQNFEQKSPSSNMYIFAPSRKAEESLSSLVGIKLIKNLPYYKDNKDTKEIESTISSYGFCISPLEDQGRFKISFDPQHTIKGNYSHLSKTRLETTLLTITSEGTFTYPHEKSKNKFYSLYPNAKKAIEEAAVMGEGIQQISAMSIL